MMKTSLLAAVVALTLTTGARALEPATSVPPGKPAPTGKTAVKTSASTAEAAAVTPPPPAPAPKPPPASVLDEYMVELVAVVNLSDPEKKQVEDIYTEDGPALQKILNDDSLSPLVKAQQVSDLRDVRNARIDSLLHDVDRQKAFREVEAIYRVALTNYAADGGLSPAPPTTAATPPPAPASAPTMTAPPATAVPAVPPAAK